MCKSCVYVDVWCIIKSIEQLWLLENIFCGKRKINAKLVEKRFTLVKRVKCFQRKAFASLRQSMYVQQKLYWKQKSYLISILFYLENLGKGYAAPFGK